MPTRAGARRSLFFGKTVLAVPPVASFLQPYNYLYQPGPGDSRVAQGGQFSGVYGSSTPTDSPFGSGSQMGLDAVVPFLLDNKIRALNGVPNFGIGGQNGTNALAYPRPNGNPWTMRLDNGTAGQAGNTITISAKGGGGAAIKIGDKINVPGGNPAVVTVTAFLTGAGDTGSTMTVDGTAQSIASSSSFQPVFVYNAGNKLTLADTAASQAAIIIMHAPMTNGNASASDVLAMTNAMKALTNPSFTHPGYGAPLPLYNGQPKNLIVFNDVRSGRTTTGTSNQAKTSAGALAMYNASQTLLKYDYASGDPLANSRIIVIDTFNDPVRADLTDTTTYQNQYGFEADGLHDAPPGVMRTAVQTRSKALTLFTGPTFERLPDTTTVGNFLLDNPLFVTQSGGTNVNNAGTLTGTIPANWRLGFDAWATVAITYDALPGNLGYAMNLRITGTPDANRNITLVQLLSATQRAKINMATDTLRLSHRSKFRIDAGQIYNATMALQFGIDGNSAIQVNNGFVGAVAGYTGNSAFSQMLENAYASAEWTDWITWVTRNASIAQFGATGNPPSNQANVTQTLSFKSGVAVDVTLTLAQIGLAKVTD